MNPLTIGISIRLFTPNSGGLQYYAAALVRHLREKGYNVVIVTRAVSRTPTYRDFFLFSEPKLLCDSEDNIQPKILRHARWLNPFMWFVLKFVGRSGWRTIGINIYNLIYAPKIKKLFAGVDLIHHIGQGSEMIGFAAAKAARGLRVPFLVQPTIHPGQWGDAAIDFMLYKVADGLLVYTNYEKKFFHSQGILGPTTVVGAGIEDRIDGNGNLFRTRYGINGPIILFVGRKDTDKGYPLVLSAFAKIRVERPDVTLVSMGPGKPATQKLEGVVEIGYAEESVKHDALAACDILCVPSEAESFGLVYMEAALYRKAIVARRLPVLKELLGSKAAAVLLGKENALENLVNVSADELASAICRLLSNAQERKRLGEKAFAVSRQYLWPVVITHFENAYLEALRVKDQINLSRWPVAF